MPTTFERLRSILTKEYAIAPEDVHPESTLVTLGLDSLDLIELLFEVEEQFNIRVPQESSSMRTATVQDIVDSIDKVLVPENGGSAGQ